jgi:hypothetical protein
MEGHLQINTAIMASRFSIVPSTFSFQIQKINYITRKTVPSSTLLLSLRVIRHTQDICVIKKDIAHPQNKPFNRSPTHFNVKYFQQVLH